MSYYSSTILSDSPYGLWRLDDPFVPTAKDLTVNANHGTIQGGVTVGQPGPLSLDSDTAMLFNGTDGLILLPPTLSVNGWGAITIETWMNLSNLTFGYTANLMANDSPNTSHLGVQLGVTATTVVFRIGTGSATNALTVNKTFAANTWYHVTATFDGTTMTVYIRDLTGNLTTGTTTSAWYNTSYQYRKQIIIDHTKVSGSADLPSFPVPVSMTDANLKTVANGGNVQNSSGYDLIFVDSTQTVKLDHEIGKYVATTGEIEMWVRIPTLSHTTDTTIYCYFGNAAISSSQENKTGVWDSNYKRVHHLSNGTTLSLADSTSNAATATNNGATATGGKIDGGAQIASDSSYMSLPTAGLPTGANPFSVAFWVNSSEGSDGHALCTFGQVALYYTVSSGVLNLYTGSGHNSASSTLANGSWYHLAITYDGTTLKLYVNGTVVVSVTITLNISYGIAYIGNDSFSEAVQGIYDEVEYSNTARSIDWIVTEYNSQNSPSTFFSVGGLTNQTGTTIAATTNQLMIGARPGGTPNNFPGLLDEVVLYNYALASTQDLTHFAAGTITQQPYLYGPFQIANHSGGLGYFLVAKDLDLPTYKPTLSPIARADLWKVNGWQVDARNIQVDLVVLGSSRVDCIARKRTLEQALSLRDQELVIHEDGSYWIANATTGRAKFSAGTGIVQARIPVTFVCADPYAKAVAAAAPYDTGSLAYTASGSSYVSPIFTVVGGGTAYSYPQLHLVNKTASLGSTTLTTALVQGQSYNAILVSNTSFSGTVGQVLTLYALVGGQLWTQKVTVSAAYATSAVQINVNAFTAAFNFPNTTTVYVSTAWNQVTVSQLTDNYTLSVTSTSAAPLPQTLNDFLDIYTDPSNGMYIATNGLSQYLDFTGAFPPLEPGSTQWQVSIGSDAAPTVDAVWAWTPRWLS